MIENITETRVSWENFVNTVVPELNLDLITHNPKKYIDQLEGFTVQIDKEDFDNIVYHPLMERLWQEQRWYWHWDSKGKTFKKHFYPVTPDTMVFFNSTTWIIK